MPIFRELLTKLGFKIEDGKLTIANKRVAALTKRMNVAARSAKKVGRNINSSFALIKTAVGGFLASRALAFVTTGYATSADSAAKFATATGIATDVYQGLTHAVQLGGADIATLQKALPQLAARAGKAAEGNKTYGRSFRELGINVKDAHGNLKRADTLFFEMADGLVNLEDKQRRTKIAMELLGRTGAVLLPTFLEGSKGIRKMMLEAKALGIVMTRKQLKAAEQFNDEMLRMKSVFIGVRNQIAAKLLPKITRAMRDFHLWAREGDNLAKALERVKKTLKVIGFIAAGLAIKKLIRAFQLLIFASRAAVVALRAFGWAGAFAQAKILGLVVLLLALVLLIDDLVVFAMGGDSIFGRALGDTAVGKEVKALLLDIRDAALDIGKTLGPAFKELWESLKPIGKSLWELFKQLLPAALVLLKAVLTIILVLVIAVNFAIKGLIIGVRALIRAFIWLGRTIADGWGIFIDGLKGAGALVKGVWMLALHGIQGSFWWLVNTMLDGWGVLVGGARKAAELISRPFIWIAKQIGKAWDAAIGGIKKLIDGIVGALRSAIGLMKAALGLQDVGPSGIGAAAKIGRAAIGGQLAKGATNNVRVGSVAVTVKGTTGMTPDEMKKAVARGTKDGLQQAVTQGFRNRQPVVPR